MTPKKERRLIDSLPASRKLHDITERVLAGRVHRPHNRRDIERWLEHQRRQNASVADRIGIPAYDPRDGTL